MYTIGSADMIRFWHIAIDIKCSTNYAARLAYCYPNNNSSYSLYFHRSITTAKGRADKIAGSNFSQKTLFYAPSK